MESHLLARSEEHKVGDVVSGRVIDVSDRSATAELGDGIHAPCRLKEGHSGEAASSTGVDLSALTSLLQARWRGATDAPAKPEPLRSGQVRNFRIVELDAEAKKIAVETA